MVLNKSISEKIWILSWGIDLQTAKYFSLGVSNDSDAIQVQEHHYTGVKIVGCFYNDAEYSFLFIKITFLNQANDSKCWKVQNTYERGRERDNSWRF